MLLKRNKILSRSLRVLKSGYFKIISLKKRFSLYTYMNCITKESEFHFLPHLTNNFGKFLGFQELSGHNVCQFQFLRWLERVLVFFDALYLGVKIFRLELANHDQILPQNNDNI